MAILALSWLILVHASSKTMRPEDSFATAIAIETITVHCAATAELPYASVSDRTLSAPTEEKRHVINAALAREAYLYSLTSGPALNLTTRCANRRG